MFSKLDAFARQYLKVFEFIFACAFQPLRKTLRGKCFPSQILDSHQTSLAIVDFLEKIVKNESQKFLLASHFCWWVPKLSITNSLIPPPTPWEDFIQSTPQTAFMTTEVTRLQACIEPELPARRLQGDGDGDGMEEPGFWGEGFSSNDSFFEKLVELGLGFVLVHNNALDSPPKKVHLFHSCLADHFFFGPL